MFSNSTERVKLFRADWMCGVLLIILRDFIRSIIKGIKKKIIPHTSIINTHLNCCGSPVVLIHHWRKSLRHRMAPTGLVSTRSCVSHPRNRHRCDSVFCLGASCRTTVKPDPVLKEKQQYIDFYIFCYLSLFWHEKNSCAPRIWIIFI